MTEAATIAYFYALSKLTKPRIKQFTPTSPELEKAKEKLRKAMQLELNAIRMLKQEHKAIKHLETQTNEDKNKNTLELLKRLETKLDSIKKTSPGVDDKKISDLRLKLQEVRKKIK